MTSTRSLLRACAFSAATIVALSLAPLSAHAAPPPLNTNAAVDVTPAGALSNGDVEGIPSISADGRYVAFASRATNLHAVPTSGALQIYRRDLATNVTTLISAAGMSAGNADSRAPVVSDDGQTVAYLSSATNIAPGATNGVQQALLWSAETGGSLLVSHSAAGELTPVDEPVDAMDLAGGGENVVFLTSTSDVIGTDYPVANLGRLYKWNSSGSTSLVAANLTLQADSPSISDDGRFVAFRSSMDHMMPDADQTVPHDNGIFVRDTVAKTSQLVNSMPRGYQPQFRPTISGNGQVVAFAALDFATGNTETSAIFAFDRVSGATTNETPGLPKYEYDAALPSLSRDGSKLSFSLGSDVNERYSAEKWQVFSRDRVTKVTTLVSQSRTRDEGNANSLRSSISADGRFVAFSSVATNLSPLGGLGRNQVLVRAIG